GADIVPAPVVGGGPLRVSLKEIVDGLDLLCAPEFVAVDLPEQARLPDAGQRGVHHLPLAIPELTKRLALNQDLVGEAAPQVVEIARGAVVASPFAMAAGRDPPAARDAPAGVVLQRGDTFDHVPVPGDRQPPQDALVVTDERLAVQDDGEEVYGERM